MVKSQSQQRFMQLFRRKFERGDNRRDKDVAAFTSLENKSRYLSEGRATKPIHSKEVLEEIRTFRIEIEKRYKNNETKNYVFPK